MSRIMDNLAQNSLYRKANFGIRTWHTTRYVEREVKLRLAKKVVERRQSLPNTRPLAGCSFEFLDLDQRLLATQMHGVEAYWVSPGGYIEQSEVRHEVFELPHADQIGVHVSEFEMKLIQDRRSWKGLREMIVRAIVTGIEDKAKKLQEVAPNAKNHKYALWGKPDAKGFTDQDNWYYHYVLRWEFGGLAY